MPKYLLRRLVYGAVLMLCVIVLNFFLIHAAPGDAVDAIVAESGGADPAVVAQLRASYGLDKPLYVQLYKYLGKMCTGDFGQSFHYHASVLSVIMQRLPETLMLTISALILAVIIGTVLGVIAALQPDGWRSHFVTLISLVGYATPVFWLGMMVLMVFANQFPLFPAYGLTSVPPPETAWALAVDIAYHLVLPVFTLSILFLASYSRIARASMLDVLGSDYIRTARAKGLLESVVVLKHALRNAALPIVTLAGLQLGQAFSGAVLVEVVFSLPGIGPLLYDSIIGHDYPLMLGILFGSAFTVVTANILTDLVYRILDPRIRLHEQ
ncbi:MAG: ABC transporter permease [Candidimonas sp.]|nr:MAG: ABC transporter permease [Candidimonas sp.]TAM25742.1 MAG: ABC transporter permease [Candidimonas sp.]TAM74041.1 MAG: ABC transporter permease [Candidimonas sp.]